MSEHTKELWRISERGHSEGMCDIDDENGFTVVASVGDLVAQRIVACVNACNGIPNETLRKEKYIETASYALRAKAESELQTMQAEITRLKDANNDLVEALEQTMNEAQANLEYMHCNPRSKWMLNITWKFKAQALLAKAKGRI